MLPTVTWNRRGSLSEQNQRCGQWFSFIGPHQQSLADLQTGVITRAGPHLNLLHIQTVHSGTPKAESLQHPGSLWPTKQRHLKVAVCRARHKTSRMASWRPEEPEGSLDQRLFIYFERNHNKDKSPLFTWSFHQNPSSVLLTWRQTVICLSHQGHHLVLILGEFAMSVKLVTVLYWTPPS